MRARYPEVRWIEPASLHLTLVFLGATEQRHIAHVTVALAEVATAARPFDVSLGAGSGWVGARRGGVAWLQVVVGSDQLARLAQQLDKRLSGLRAGRINPPHLTVARGVDDAALADLKQSRTASGIGWRVERIGLWRSHTAPRGVAYEEIAGAWI